MTKWVIRALSPDGSVQYGEYESHSASSALVDFEVDFYKEADEWLNIDIDRAEE